MARPPSNVHRRPRSYRRQRGLKGQLKTAGRNFLASIAGGLGLFTGLALGNSLGLPTWAGVALMFAGFGIGYFGVYWRRARWLLGGRKSRPRKWARKQYQGGLRPVLITILVITVSSIGVLYIYHFNHKLDASQPSDAARFDCRVSRVIDGDTLVCSQGQRVRLHAVAARETDGSCTVGHPCPNASAEAATAKLRELVQGGPLQCKPTGTSHNRVTAICTNRASVEINCAMVHSGTALRWPRFEKTEPLCSGRYGDSG